mmetsp:Transcript_52608/g.52986  ORF Transcript_52608/g.52986 Transcript_52608/m.52986 type:complete len:228 (+) Transcript_52608:608-1291(+)
MISWVAIQTSSKPFDPSICTVLHSLTSLSSASTTGQVCSTNVSNRFFALTKLSSVRPDVSPRDKIRCCRISTGQSNTSVPNKEVPLWGIMSHQPCKLSKLRGKPSIRNMGAPYRSSLSYSLLATVPGLGFATAASMASLNNPSEISTGTILPCTKHSEMSAEWTLDVSSLAARRRSPADKWTQRYLETRLAHWVPLPAPGPPRMKRTLWLDLVVVEVVVPVGRLVEE